MLPQSRPEWQWKLEDVSSTLLENIRGGMWNEAWHFANRTLTQPGWFAAPHMDSVLGLDSGPEGAISMLQVKVRQMALIQLEGWQA